MRKGCDNVTDQEREAESLRLHRECFRKDEAIAALTAQRDRLLNERDDALGDALESLGAARAEVEAVSRTNNDLRNERFHTNAKLVETQESLKLSYAERGELTRERDQIRADLARMTRERDQLRADLARMTEQAKHARLVSDRGGQEQRGEGFNLGRDEGRREAYAEFHPLRAERDALQGEVERLTANLAQSRRETSDAEALVERARGAGAIGSAALAEALGDADALRETLRHERLDAGGVAVSLRAELVDAQAEIERLNVEVRDLLQGVREHRAERAVKV